MSRVVHVLKRRVHPLYNKRHQAQQALLIWCRDDNNATWLHQSRELAHECARIFDMFDRLDRCHYVCGAVREWGFPGLKIKLHKLDIRRQGVISYDIDAEIPGTEPFHHRPQAAGAATDVKKQLPLCVIPT